MKWAKTDCKKSMESRRGWRSRPVGSRLVRDGAPAMYGGWRSRPVGSRLVRDGAPAMYGGKPKLANVALSGEEVIFLKEACPF